MTYQDHPIAAIFPLLDAESLSQLTSDIRTNGLKQDIVLYEGKILDGRNRYRACIAASVQPTCTVYGGDDPVGHVLSLNLHRRHLTASQRAVVAQDALPHFEEEARKRMTSGVNQHSPVAIVPQGSDGKSRDKAAALVDVSPRYVSDAKRVAEKSPETLERVRSGEITLPQAVKEIQQPQPIKDIVCSEAKELWRIAKNRLDNIRDNDPLRNEVFAEVAAYAAKKLKK